MRPGSDFPTSPRVGVWEIIVHMLHLVVYYAFGTRGADEILKIEKRGGHIWLFALLYFALSLHFSPANCRTMLPFGIADHRQF